MKYIHPEQTVYNVKQFHSRREQISLCQEQKSMRNEQIILGRKQNKPTSGTITFHYGNNKLSCLNSPEII